MYKIISEFTFKLNCMKKFKLMSLILSVVMGFTLSGCNEEDNIPTDGGLTASNDILFENGTTIGNGEQEFVFTGNQTLPKGIYHLKGWVYIRDGAQLTIEPGTIIKGDKETKAALIVERGGKLIAKGTATEPIVFTSEQAAGSRRPGDWGGLIICGKAKNNQGNDMQIEGGPGDNDADNSGILSYVRVEFAGFPFEKDKEINGITFGSVGSGTQVDHVQVSYSNDDSYEWFGGTVNCKYLVAFNGWDDEFDTDNGFSGKVQFCLSVRDPRIADVSQSNGFESDNCADGATVSPYTTATFSNVTFIGPRGRDGFENKSGYITGGSVNPANGSGLGLFQAAMQIRRSSHLACFNSVAVGYPVGLIIDGEKGNTVETAKAGGLKLQHIYFANMGIVGSDANKSYGDTLITYTGGKTVGNPNVQSYSHTFFESQAGNEVYDTATELKLSDGTTTRIGVEYLPVSDSPLLGKASFSDALLNSGFDKVTYIGAFSGIADTWLNHWTNFDPQHTDYSELK